MKSRDSDQFFQEQLLSFFSWIFVFFVAICLSEFPVSLVRNVRHDPYQLRRRVSGNGTHVHILCQEGNLAYVMASA